MLSLLFGDFALDMKRKNSGIFLEDSRDLNSDGQRLSHVCVAPRYSHFSELSKERIKDNFRKSEEEKNKMGSKGNYKEESDRDDESATALDPYWSLLFLKPKKKIKKLL